MPAKKQGAKKEVTTIHPKAPDESAGEDRVPIEQTAAAHTYDNYKRWDNLPEDEVEEVSTSSPDVTVSTNKLNDATSVVTTTAGDATVEYYSKNLTEESVSKAKNVIEQTATAKNKTNKAKTNSNNKGSEAKQDSNSNKKKEAKEKDSLKTETLAADVPWFSEGSALLSSSATTATTVTDNAAPLTTSAASSSSSSSSAATYSSSGCDAMPYEEEEEGGDAASSSSATAFSSSTSSSSSSSSSSSEATVFAPQQVARAPVSHVEPSSTQIVSTLMDQLKAAQAEIMRRDLIISRIRRELHEADLTDIVSSAQDAAAKFLDEGTCENRGRDEEDQEALTVDAIALVTEKLFLEKEINIDQKAYVNLAILPKQGKEHFRVVDVMDSFKDRPAIEVDELTKWIRKWTNASPEVFDPYCSCRAWIKRMGKTIEATYGYTSKPVDLTQFSTTYSAATNFLEMCNPTKAFADAAND